MSDASSALPVQAGHGNRFSVTRLLVGQVGLDPLKRVMKRQTQRSVLVYQKEGDWEGFPYLSWSLSCRAWEAG